MSKNIVRLPEEIKQEFRVDLQGKITTSIRGAARLADIDESSLRYALNTSAGEKPSQLAVFLIEQGIDGAGIDNWIQTGIPDIAIAFILEYYAYECREDRRKEQAKRFCRAFRAIGFRVWAQNELGWQKPMQPESKANEAAFILDIAAKSAINAGVDPEIAEQLRLEGLAKLFPKYNDVLLLQKNAIASVKPLPEIPMNPTEVGKKLAVELGLEKVSAKKVNSKLLELGYQVSVTRIKKSNGKEVHHYYQPAEKAEAHSQLQLTAYSQGEGKSTKPQLRWFSSIVPILVNNWEEN